MYTKLVSKDLKNQIRKPRGFESNGDRSISDADSESPTWLAYNISYRCAQLPWMMEATLIQPLRKERARV